MRRKSRFRVGAFAGLLFAGSLALWIHAPRIVPESAQPKSGAEPPLLTDSAPGPEPEVSSTHRWEAAPSFARADFRDDWAMLVAELEGDTNHLRLEIRAARLQEFVSNLPTNDLPAVFAELLEGQELHPTEVARDLRLRLLQRWLEVDLPAAAQAASTVPAEERQEVYERVAAIWARQDFAESVSWAQGLSDPAERQTALLSIACEIASQNPIEAIQLASQTAVPPEKMPLLTQAASAWAAEAPETAAEWARQIPEGPLRDGVLVGIATSWADQNPQAAAQLVIESVSPGQDQQNAVLGIMQRFAFQNLEAALSWAQRFPEGPLREQALAELGRIAGRQRLVPMY